MKKNQIQNVIIHASDNMDLRVLASKINEFHVDIIERRLNNSNLTLDDKIAVIDHISKNLKSRERDGLIK